MARARLAGTANRFDIFLTKREVIEVNNIHRTVISAFLLGLAGTASAQEVTASHDGTVSVGERGPSGHGQVDIGLDRSGHPDSIGVSGSRGGTSGGVSIGRGGASARAGHDFGDTSVDVGVSAGHDGSGRVEAKVKVDFD